jgi:hypothetical protein
MEGSRARMARTQEKNVTLLESRNLWIVGPKAFKNTAIM